MADNIDMLDTADQPRPGTSKSTIKPETKQPKRSLKTYDDFEEEVNTKQPKESNNKDVKMSRFKNSNWDQVKRRTNNNLLAGGNKREGFDITWHNKEINESNPQIMSFKRPTKRDEENAIKVMKNKLKSLIN